MTSLDVVLQPNGGALAATGAELSIKQKGNFLGFSVELSVADQILGSSAQNLKVPFLNYLANIRTRAGQGPIVRVGGNTQENSTYYSQGLPKNAVINKIKIPGQNTPTINYSPDLFYAMSNISALVDTQWYFGLAFNVTDVADKSDNIPLAALAARNALGDRLLGLQIGNEPDLYADHNSRPSNYNVTNYAEEFSSIADFVLSTDSFGTDPLFVGPGICCDVAGFELQDVYNTGWLQQNAQDLAIVAVQHYPTNNCQVNGNVIDAQTIFPNFLNHTLAQALTQPYMPLTPETLAAGKNIMMFEFNSASCGGFPGLSDSFGISMWMTDYALQMAYRNFTAALMHVGGQSTYYNPFTPPPSSVASNYQWTTGSVYYSALVVAEAFGSSNVSQVVDLNPNNGSIYSPAYAIYENDAPTRVVLFNYVSDGSGASNYNAVISVAGGSLPQGTVQVRYLQAPSVSEKYNITWAGQTMGNSFESDGRLSGSEQTVTINCDTTANTCTIPVYAPSIAIVFLTNAAAEASFPSSASTMTYGTTVIGTGSATVDPAVLSTSNGQMGNGQGLGSTSSGSVSSAQRLAALGGGASDSTLLAATSALGLSLIALLGWQLA